MKAANVIYEVEEGRKCWKLKPLQILVTLVIMLLTTIIVLAILVSGPVAQRVGDIVGAGDTAVTVFNIAKWPVIALIVSQIFAFLYWIGPNVKQPGFRWVSPGGFVPPPPRGAEGVLDDHRPPKRAVVSGGRS